jgi:P4 family phage/plasmid primase-like protien
MVICSEVNRGDRFDEAKVKSLSGPDGKLTGRSMGQNFFDFTASHTLILTGNETPEVSAGGPSFWDRLMRIMFEYYVPPEKRIKGLASIIFREEGEAVMGWIVDGCLDYLRFGLTAPPKVTAATDEYRASQDPLGRFVDDCLHVGAGLTSDHRVASKSLMALHRGWCREMGEHDLSETKLMADLTSRYKLGKARSGNTRYRTHVAVRDGAALEYAMGALL